SGVSIWDRDTGQASSITAVTGGDETVVDFRAGWTEGGTLLYLRTFPAPAPLPRPRPRRTPRRPGGRERGRDPLGGGPAVRARAPGRHGRRGPRAHRCRLGGGRPPRGR